MCAIYYCISKIDNTEIDNAKNIDVVMPMYILIDIPAVNNNGNIVDFNGANATDSFNFKTKITGQTNNNGRIECWNNGSIKILK